MANNKSAKKNGGIKEVIRKSMVSLKRSPQRIPLAALLAAFFIYSLNLSSIANTTARINGANMGQCEFAAMLFSILAFVVFLRSFPRRQKANKLMLGLLFFMLALLVCVDAVYITRIVDATTRAENTIVIDASSEYINTARTIVTLHVVFIGVTAALLALLPFYSKAIRRINTSIEVEGNGSMAAIDISGEDN
ncbi:hypothetical protein [Ruminococcus sp.]|uniref:hypothetical protein n=1 Tax=Ruminococcus sp. TaxID=41978 RepID=UPI0025DC0DDB|nr:hypothetical protein [Ruminococcus sp.]MBQ8967415.1 hypothetical protein [Ruminococcus sp.]